MARNSVTHAIRLLIIGMIICFAIVKTITKESSWTTISFGIASSEMEKCVRYCKEEYADDPTKMKDCIMKCVVLECRDRHHRDDPKRKKECIHKLFEKYTKHHNIW
ncbi:hypothetical protein HN51_045230 [Arachis hypogaea]